MIFFLLNKIYLIKTVHKRGKILLLLLYIHTELQDVQKQKINTLLTYDIQTTLNIEKITTKV